MTQEERDYKTIQLYQKALTELDKIADPNL